MGKRGVYVTLGRGCCLTAPRQEGVQEETAPGAGAVSGGPQRQEVHQVCQGGSVEESSSGPRLHRPGTGLPRQVSSTKAASPLV